MIHYAGPILKGRVTDTLSARFTLHVAFDTVNVSVVGGLEVSGDGLRIYPPANVAAAGAKQPVIAVQHLSFHSALIGLLLQATRVGVVRVTGLEINIPPR